MLKRLLRSAIVFAAVFAAYQAYALLAVPWMEPPLALHQGPQPSDDDIIEGRDALNKYQQLLANYFPQGHWTQTMPPKVFASAGEQAMLVLDSYERLAVTPTGDQRQTPDGGNASPSVQLKIDRFALLVFPTPLREGVTAPQDVIILEAPQGAMLQFDEFVPERGRIGQITYGQFPGRITIRSNMHEPGPEDDLLVETADLQMNTRRLFTNSPVAFRMGQNVGGGQGLEISFQTDEHVQPHDSGFKFAGVESLEILREVRMRLQLEMDTLLPGEETASDAGSRAPRAPGSHALRGNPITSRSGGEAPPSIASTQSVGVVRSRAERGNERPKPPVELTCSGPFRFDFVRYVASVDRDVLLRQINPNGPSDQVTCNQLDIHFAPKPRVEGQVDPVIVDVGRRQQRDLGRLEPAAIVAVGNPVVVTSPARSAEARGGKIQIDLRDRRLMIGDDQGQNVSLAYGPNLLLAPVIEYQHPAPDSESGIGRFRANGPGSLHFVPDATRPDQVLRATWQRLVELGRDKGQPLLSLEGRPEVSFADAGAISADAIKISLREVQGGGAIGLGSLSGGSNGPNRLNVVPDRLAALGRVVIQSAQLRGNTHELFATFRRQPAGAVASNAELSGGNPGGGATNQFQLNPEANSSQQAFKIDADRIQIQVDLAERTAAPSTVVCDGHVLIREVPAVRSDQQPFEISGGRVTIDQLGNGTAHLILTGVGPGDAPGTKLATLGGRGITVLAEGVELDQRDNRLWSNGEGNATLLVARDLNGHASPTPIPLHVSWKGGLEFDGRTIVIRRDVKIEGSDNTLNADQLSASLTRRVKFGERVDEQAIQLAEVECRGNVSIDHRSRDAVDVVSHERVQLAWININQQTGQIRGEGPGVIRSTRFGNGLGSIAGPQNGSAIPSITAATPSAANSHLYFLGLDFQRGIEGNLYTRNITFNGRVRTVYGPVDSWEQELDVSRPESLPPETVRLLCDELRLNEDPLAARAIPGDYGATNRPLGKVQLQAKGNVRIDGQAAERGPFVAQADRASYDQVKDVFLLEGDPRVPATIWYPGQTGPPPAFRKISFVRSTGELSVGGLLYLEVTPGDVENARRAGNLRQ